MKKILAIVLALAMVIVPMTFSVSADAAATLTLGADTTVEAGEAIAIPVSISGDVAGAQFVVALGDLEYVGCSADAESFVYNADTNTIKYVDADLDGMTDLFTINATVPEDAEAGATYALSASDLVICDIDEALIDTAVVAGTYTVASSVVEPVLDSNIKFYNIAVNISDTIGVGYFLTNAQLASYARYELVVTPQKYDGNYNEYTAEPVVLTNFVASGSKRVFTTFTGVGMYELGLNISAYVKCYDADDNFVAYSETTTNTPAALLKTLCASSSNAKFLTAATDLLNMGAELQQYFGAQKPDSDLAAATLINAGFDQTYASASLGTLNTANNTNWASGSTLSSSTNALTTAVAMGASPAVGYLLRDKAGALDTSKLVMEVSYTTLYGGEKVISQTISGDDWVRSGNYWTASFGKTCLYDSNKTVTAKIYYNGTLCCTNQYSVETAVNTYSTNSSYVSVGKFGASIREYFGTN